MNIFKNNETGVYYVSFWTPKGTVERSTKCTRLEDAKLAVAEAGIERMELLAKAGSLNMEAARAMLGGKSKTIPELAAEFEVWLRDTNISAVTIATNVEKLNTFIRHLDGEYQYLADVPYERVRMYVNSRGQTFPTRENALKILKKFYEWASNAGYIQGNMIKNIRIDLSLIPQDKRKSKPYEPVSEEGFRKLLAAAPKGSFFRAAVAIAWWTGLRYRDVVHLEWSCLGKTSLKIQTGKTGAWVEIPYESQELTEILSELTMEDTRYVFPKQQKRYPQICKSMVRYWNYSGSSFHGLRHAFATRMAAKGIDLVHIRRCLGHASDYMTRRYIHFKRNGSWPQASDSSQSACPPCPSSETQPPQKHQ